MKTITKNLWYIFISHNKNITYDSYNISTMMNKFEYKNFLIFYGGKNLRIENENVVNIDCYDGYCGLPEKINKAFKHCKKHINSDFIVKVDRTMRILKLINPFFIPYSYCGHIVTFKNTNYHFEKCKDTNCVWYNKSFNGEKIKYCSGGGGYILDRKCIDIIAQDDLFYRNNVYEDYYIGDLLKKYNILPEKMKLKNYLYDKNHEGIFK
jgi:hypothetical protein